MADIKTAAPQTSAPATAQSRSGPAGGIPFIGPIVARIEAILKPGAGHLDVGMVNNVLIVIIALMIIYFFFSLNQSFSKLKQLSAQEFNIVSVSKSDAGFKEIAAMKGVAYYVGKLSGRDFFRRQAKLELPGSSEPVFSSKMADLTANLKLVGISMSADPDAMIEDTQIQKTFFVKKGSMIGDLKVDNITKDKVTLRMGKEYFDLK